jgi:small subunit ribosomal protein S3
MIERKFIKDNMKEHRIKEHVAAKLNKAGLSNVEVKRTPLGEKILIKAARPGMVVGRGGATINELTKEMKILFKLNNPQIEIEEVTQPSLDASIVAESIVSGLERFGTQRFKGLGHKAITDVMRSDALGVEILITGRIPSSRAKRWRFYAGYLKKCGDISISGVNTAYKVAKLKSGAVGVQVRIMPATTRIPDRVTINEAVTVKAETITPQEAEKEVAEVEKKAEEPKKAVKKETKKATEATKEDKPKKATKKVAKKATKKVAKKATKEAK